MERIITDREWNPEEDAKLILEMPLRQADINEIMAVTGPSEKTPNELILESITGHCRLGFADDVPFAVYGACPAEIPQVGIVWAVGTDLVSKGGLDLVGWGVRAVDTLFLLYPMLTNFVDARNQAHIRWLKAMRFTFTGHSVEMNGYPFLHFFKEGDTQCVTQH